MPPALFDRILDACRRRVFVDGQFYQAAGRVLDRSGFWLILRLPGHSPEFVARVVSGRPIEFVIEPDGGMFLLFDRVYPYSVCKENCV